jgi:mannose-6-phosphate isomerase-like protein (cupin superfamily)
MTPSSSGMVTTPISGKRVKFVNRPDDPARDPLEFEMWLASDGHGPMLHVHPEQDEQLEVRAGQMGVYASDARVGPPDGPQEVLVTEDRVLQPGEVVTIPADTPHRFWNASDDELHLAGSVTPGLRTEAFMRITYGLPRDGAWATPSGLPLNFLRLAVLLAEYDDMLYLAQIPVWLQRLGIRALEPFGQRAGYDNRYPEYLD